MNNKSSFVLGAMFALAVIHDISAQIKVRKAFKLALDAIEECEIADNARQAQVKHLNRIINKYEIPLDDFDLIVLNYQQ